MRRSGLIGVVIAASAVLALAATGCSDDCQDACDNYARVCDAEFRAGSLDFDRSACTSSCESNLPRCSNNDARVSCFANAKSCDAARACPACEPP